MHADPFIGMGVLVWVGGLATLAGIALLAITQGKRGWYPAIAGVVLIIGNAIVQKYFDWIAIPAVVATAMVSAAWGIVVFQQILRRRKVRKWSQQKLETISMSHSGR